MSAIKHPYGVEYRPDTLKGYLADEATKDKARNISSANLIIGETGSGKTTLAYIIAKLHKGQVVEKNMAHEGGIDEMRKLFEMLKFAPMEHDRYVVILDELHKASKSAFDALLKEVEAKSDHVIWLGMTNKPKELPAVFMTRFNKIKLDYPEPDDLFNLACDVLEAEGIPISKNVEALVDACIEKAKNNPRDTLNSLQDAIREGLHKKKFERSELLNLIPATLEDADQNALDALVKLLNDGIIPNMSIMAIYPSWSRLLNYQYFKTRKSGPKPPVDGFGEVYLKKLGTHVELDIISRFLLAINGARQNVILGGVDGTSATIAHLSVAIREIERTADNA